MPSLVRASIVSLLVITIAPLNSTIFFNAATTT
jgi:hypothetical protein